ncbi:MAG: hypothetical protein Q7W56_10830 [Candidatus Latescibacteria bacterium]|nr:hypothetical protein [Candidatus Latescibacterota bacterium]
MDERIRPSRRLAILAVAVVCVFGAGCEMVEEWFDEDRYVPFEFPLKFLIREARPTNCTDCAPQLLLSVETPLEYECSNIDLVLRVTTIPGVVEVAIGGLRYPTVGDTAIGPATYEGPLDLATGAYRLDFRRKDFVSTYRLDITEDWITVAGDDGDVAVPLQRRVARLRSNDRSGGDDPR